MSKLIIAFVAFLFALLGAPFVSGTTWYMDPDGSDSPSCSSGGTASNPFFSLTKVTECSRDGDVVSVHGGTYDFSGKSVQRVTIDHDLAIEASGVGGAPTWRLNTRTLVLPMIGLSGDITVSMTGLTVDGGATFGFVNVASGQPDLTVRDCTFVEFAQEQSIVIGGVYGELLIAGCYFDDAMAPTGADISAAGMTSMVIRDTYFEETGAYPIKALGTGASINITNCDFEGLTLFVNHARPTWYLDNSRFRGDYCTIRCDNIPASETAPEYVIVVTNSVWQDTINYAAMTQDPKCGMLLEHNRFVDTRSGVSQSTILCEDSTLVMNYNTFENAVASQAPITTCTNCSFSGTGNVWESSTGDRGTCPISSSKRLPPSSMRRQ